MAGGRTDRRRQRQFGLPVTFHDRAERHVQPLGSTLAFLNAGNCGVIANQAGNSTYAAAPAVEQVIAVVAPTVTLGISNTTQTYQAWTNFVIGPIIAVHEVPPAPSRST